MGYTKQLYGFFYQNANSANCVSGGTFGISGPRCLRLIVLKR